MIPLLIACALTVLTETAFLRAAGMRSRSEILLVICVNVATNLTMNLCFFLGVPYNAVSLAIAESAVVLTEYFLYSLYRGKSLRLFLLTLCANAISFVLGLFVMPAVSKLL